jgi:hypothetical protein
MTDLRTPPAAAPLDWTPTRGILVAAAVLALAVLVACAAIAPLGRALVLAAATAWFVVPGLFIARAIYGGQPGAWIAACLLGGPWGWGLSSLALLGFWVAGARGTWTLAVSPLVALALVPVARRLSGQLRVPHFTRGDVLAILLLLLVVPLVVGKPFANVGRDLPDGRAYRAYFTADFVWRMAVVAEVSKGDVPPRNQFYDGDTLRYYWLPHLLTAVQHRTAGTAASLEQVLLVNSIVLNLVFVAFLYGMARQLVSSRTAAVAGCLGGVLFTSFEGTERLWVVWQQGGNWDALRYLNIDSISRWFYGSLPVDGLHRLLLYQPHHAMGYAAGLSALLCAGQADDVRRPGLMVWLGTLLALAVLLSTFAGLMLTAMVATYVGLRLVLERHWRAIPLAALAGALPLVAAVGVALWLEYVDRSESLIVLGVNRMAATRTVPAIVLSFGPMLIGGLAGLWIAMRRRAPYVDIFGVIVGVSVLFYFFVDVIDHQNVYVGWRAGHFLFVAFGALTGYALQALLRHGGAVRYATAAIAAIVALAAAPMTLIDLYNTQDVSNRAWGPGFPWTLVLTPDEVEALTWVRRFTRPDARVQIEPNVRGAATWAYVPAFGERRMAAGLPISMVPLDKYVAASRRIQEVYTAPDAGTLHARGTAAGIDYLVVGPPERGAYPALEPMLDERPELARPVFRNGTMTIYRLAPEL